MNLRKTIRAVLKEQPIDRYAREDEEAEERLSKSLSPVTVGPRAHKAKSSKMSVEEKLDAIFIMFADWGSGKKGNDELRIFLKDYPKGGLPDQVVALLNDTIQKLRQVVDLEEQVKRNQVRLYKITEPK